MKPIFSRLPLAILSSIACLLLLPPAASAQTPGATPTATAAAPTLAATDIIVDNTTQPNTVLLKFSETLDPATARPITNYKVTNNSGTITYTLASTYVFNNLVTLILAATNPADAKTFITSTDIEDGIKVTPAAAIKDRDGNPYVAGPAIVALGGSHSRDTLAPAISPTLNVNSNTEVVLTFSERVNSTAAAPLTRFTLGGALSGNPTAAVLDTTNTRLTLTIPTLAGLVEGRVVTVTVGPGISDLAGNPLNPAASSASLTIQRSSIPLSFPAITRVTPGSQVESAAAAISGLTLPTLLAIATNSSPTLQCSVLKANTSAWSAYAGCSTYTLNNGDQIKLRLTAAAAGYATVTGGIQLGSTMAMFAITTAPPVLLPATVVPTPTASLSSLIFEPNPNLYISGNGVVVVPADVTSPIVLLPVVAATNNAFSIQAGASAHFTIDGRSLVLKPASPDVIAVLKSFSVDGVGLLSTLEISSGRVEITGSLGSVAPIASLRLGTTTPKQIALITTGSVAPVVDLRHNPDGSAQIAVKAGKIALRTASSASTVALSSVATAIFANEVVTLKPDGTVKQIRLGSMDESDKLIGDPLSLGASAPLSGPVFRAKVPMLGAIHERAHSSKTLMESLFDFIGPRATLTQSTQGRWGEIPLRVDGIPLYITPIGDVLIDTTRTDGIVLANDGRYEVSRNGVVVRMAPSMADLGTFATAMLRKSGTTVAIHSDGSLELTENGSTRLMQPEMFDYAASGETEGVGEDWDGILRYASNGRKQRLFPRFYNMALLITTFAPDNTAATLRDNLDGTVTATLPGATPDDPVETMTLAPAYTILSPIGGIPPEHRDSPWWMGADGLAYIKYTNGSAQGFSVR